MSSSLASTLSERKISFTASFSVQIPSFQDKDDFVSWAVQTHAKHLFSVFKSHEPFKSQGRGIPFYNPNYSETRRADDPDRSGYTKVTYRFSDVGTFAKQLLRNGPKSIPVLLPKQLKYEKYRSNGLTYKRLYAGELYESAMIEKEVEEKKVDFNACTDKKYQSKGDFWYFWDLAKPECPERTKKHVAQVAVKLEPIANTLVSFPEYDRLGTASILKIYVINGIDSKLMTDDFGVKGYYAFNQFLESAGYTKGEPTGFSLAEPLSGDPIDEARVKYTRTQRVSSKNRTIEVHSAILSQKSKNFVTFVKEAYENSDVFIYSGHSGLGGHLRVGKFRQRYDRPVAFPDKYQIFVFNGCSTYAYYNYKYFEEKGGTENLDIVSTGLASTYASNAEVAHAFIRDITSTRWLSWQQIMKNLHQITLNNRWDPKKYAPHYAASGDDDPRQRTLHRPRW